MGEEGEKGAEGAVAPGVGAGAGGVGAVSAPGVGAGGVGAVSASGVGAGSAGTDILCNSRCAQNSASSERWVLLRRLLLFAAEPPRMRIKTNANLITFKLIMVALCFVSACWVVQEFSVFCELGCDFFMLQRKTFKILKKMNPAVELEFDS